MSAQQWNAFLRQVAGDPALQRSLSQSGAVAAAALAVDAGFDVAVADLIRYQARSTTWELSDAELAVVAAWQAPDQPFWWQHIWPDHSVQ